VAGGRPRRPQDLARAPREIRAERIADREDKPVDRARQETARREQSEALRYKEYYNIDIDDLTIYDMTFNTARWGPDGMQRVVATAVDAYDQSVDEGKAAVEGVVYDF